MLILGTWSPRIFIIENIKWIIVGYWIEQKRLDEPEECEGTENESASTVSAECKKTVFSMLKCSMPPP